MLTLAKRANSYEITSRQKELLDRSEGVLDEFNKSYSKIIEHLINVFEDKRRLTLDDIKFVQSLNPLSAKWITKTALIFSELGAIHSKIKEKKIAAYFRHSATDQAKAWVRDEWEAHQADYDRNKSAFARTYVELIKNRYTDSNGAPLIVQEKNLKEKWLKSNPSASKEASLPAGG